MMLALLHGWFIQAAQQAITFTAGLHVRNMGEDSGMMVDAMMDISNQGSTRLNPAMIQAG